MHDTQFAALSCLQLASHTKPDSPRHAGLVGKLQTIEQNGGHKAHGLGKFWRQLGKSCHSSAEAVHYLASAIFVMLALYLIGDALLSSLRLAALQLRSEKTAWNEACGSAVTVIQLALRLHQNL